MDMGAFNECVTLRDSILDSNGVFAGGVWKLSELSAFSHGLFDLKEGMGGEKYFKAAFNGVTVYRDRSKWSNAAGNSATFGLGEPIMFYNGSFQTFDIGRWATIHEFGHIFDYGKNNIFQIDPNSNWSWLGRMTNQRSTQCSSNFNEPGSPVSQYAIRGA
jgi:hypothetical protein